jgi:hypothetical protein
VEKDLGKGEQVRETIKNKIAPLKSAATFISLFYFFALPIKYPFFFGYSNVGGF